MFEIYRKRPIPGGFVVDDTPCATFDFWTMEIRQDRFVLKKAGGDPIVIKADHMNYVYRHRYAGQASEVRTPSYYE